MRHERLDRTLRQHRTKPEGHVCTVHHFEHGNGEGARQTLAAVLDRRRQGVPSSFRELPISLRKSGHAAHRAILIVRADFVAWSVERRQYFLGKLAAGVENRGDGFIVEACERSRFHQARNVDNVIEREGDVADWCAPGHGRCSDAGNVSEVWNLVLAFMKE